jgi:hypothetical protein
MLRVRRLGNVVEWFSDASQFSDATAHDAIDFQPNAKREFVLQSP